MNQKHPVIMHGDQTGEELPLESLLQLFTAMSSEIFTDFHLVEISRNLINKAFNPLLPLAFCLLPSAQRYIIRQPLEFQDFDYRETPEANRAPRAIYESVLESLYDACATSDLGGQMTTSEFTDEVIRRVKSKLEAWAVLGTS